MTPQVLRRRGAGRFVIICDHASNHIPAELNDLWLPGPQLVRHIAWDIGAAGITAELSSLLDSPAVLSAASRLVIDCNRHLTAADLIPERSDGVAIPGNLHLTAQERTSRVEQWFTPYHETVESVIAERVDRGSPAIVLSIHSMTEQLAGKSRPWQISLSSFEDRSLAQPMLDALRRTGEVVVGDNEPYDLDPAVDFSIPFHAMRRNLRYLQVEFRQDQITETAAQVSWARRLAEALGTAIP